MHYVVVLFFFNDVKIKGLATCCCPPRVGTRELTHPAKANPPSDAIPSPSPPAVHQPSDTYRVRYRRPDTPLQGSASRGTGTPEQRTRTTQLALLGWNPAALRHPSPPGTVTEIVHATWRGRPRFCPSSPATCLARAWHMGGEVTCQCCGRQSAA